MPQGQQKGEKGEVQVRPFADFLVDHNRGVTAAECSEKLHDVVARVRDTGKKGTLTITVSVDPMKGDVDTLLVLIDVKSKLPEFDRRGAVFFPDDQGNLVREDPRQPHLPLKSVDGADPDELKEVGQ